MTTPSSSHTPRPASSKPAPSHSSAKRPRGGYNSHAHPLPLLLTPPSRPLTLLSYLAPRFLQPTNLANPRCIGHWDASSKSVWITRPQDVAILWGRGFWGKGSLSRSEPTWLQRARNRKVEKAFGEGKGGVQLTAEEVTAKRRVERREGKILKAKEKAAASLDAHSVPGSPLSLIASPSLNAPAPPPAPDPNAPLPAGGSAGSAPSAAAARPPRPRPLPKVVLPPELEAELATIQDFEHLQLLPEESFFLSFSLGCLSVSAAVPSPSTPDADDDGQEPLLLAPLALWDLCLSAHSDPARGRTGFGNPFLVRYAAFHHFRSHGWVVRSGIKFCTDYVMYGQRGPVGGHAEFAVCVIPAYEDPVDDPALQPDIVAREGRDLSKDRRSWRWFSTVNRVCASVKKTLVLAYVVVPSTKGAGKEAWRTPSCLGMYRVREVVVRRFIPARMRD